MLTLDKNGEFETIFLGEPKGLGITAKKKGQRWQYRDTATGRLYASGMDPAAFAKKFWYRDDFTDSAA